MNTNHRTDTLSIRWERSMPGCDYSDRQHVFGLFRDGQFWTATHNNTAAVMMEHGMGVTDADGLLLHIAENDLAYDVANGNFDEL